MSTESGRGRATRIALIALLAVAVMVLAVVIAVLLPILTHTSAGGSGQQVPTDFVSSSQATGDDGRVRELRVESADGAPADLGAVAAGDTFAITGSGFDAGIGIYVSVCAIPDTPAQKPGPCLGGIPEGAEEGNAATEDLTSAWVTDDWAWRAFATHRYSVASAGTFAVELTVPAAASNGIDCRETRCAITTRADHTASDDRAQDMLLPVRYAD
ncbi:hypothetical protein [Leucobacter sp. gxy201]|uniref:hypothetical protein n=1 Tax=Leucobacter sp. gxy201 TaxID=2957200 RepID=UPI003DA0CC1F